MERLEHFAYRDDAELSDYQLELMNDKNPHNVEKKPRAGNGVSVNT